MRADARDNRARIMTAADDVFGRSPGASTDDVAKLAGVGIATVFRHFATKEELYAAILDRKACSHDGFDPAEMAAAVQPSMAVPVTVGDDARRAVLDAIGRAAEDDVIVITGSLYFLGEVRPALGDVAARQAEKRSPPPR